MISCTPAHPVHVLSVNNVQLDLCLDSSLTSLGCANCVLCTVYGCLLLQLCSSLMTHTGCALRACSVTIHLSGPAAMCAVHCRQGPEARFLSRACPVSRTWPLRRRPYTQPCGLETWFAVGPGRVNPVSREMRTGWWRLLRCSS